MLNTPTLRDVKEWLGLSEDDHDDDVVLQESLNAALEAQGRVCCYPCDAFGDRYFSDDLRVAVYLRCVRTASRRNSPEGVVGLTGVGGDFVAARLANFDSDVWVFEGPHRLIVVA